MPKKKILVLTPDTPDPSYIETVVSPLSFLEDEYTIHPIDSLLIMEEVDKITFYQLWAQKLKEFIPYYDAFLGFSFGGVIIQQCFPLFTNLNKPIVLLSTPTFADKALTQKLENVITLCDQGQIEQALNFLYQHVYYPNEAPELSHDLLDKTAAAKRVIYGLSRVLETDASSILKTNDIKHLHLIGEQSHLVNIDNVIPSKAGTLISVPDAGMRVLRDYPLYCKKAIMETLNCEP